MFVPIPLCSPSHNPYCLYPICCNCSHRAQCAVLAVFCCALRALIFCASLAVICCALMCLALLCFACCALLAVLCLLFCACCACWAWLCCACLLACLLAVLAVLPIHLPSIHMYSVYWDMCRKKKTNVHLAKWVLQPKVKTNPIPCKKSPSIC